MSLSCFSTKPNDRITWDFCDGKPPVVLLLDATQYPLKHAVSRSSSQVTVTSASSELRRELLQMSSSDFLAWLGAHGGSQEHVRIDNDFWSCRVCAGQSFGMISYPSGRAISFKSAEVRDHFMRLPQEVRGQTASTLRYWDTGFFLAVNPGDNTHTPVTNVAILDPAMGGPLILFASRAELEHFHIHLSNDERHAYCIEKLGLTASDKKWSIAVWAGNRLVRLSDHPIHAAGWVTTPPVVLDPDNNILYFKSHFLIERFSHLSREDANKIHHCALRTSQLDTERERQHILKEFATP